MNGRGRETRWARRGTHASAALLVAIGIACGTERPTRPPPRQDGRGGTLVLQTRGRGYVAIDGSYANGCYGTCELTIPPGQAITIWPRPNACFEFVGWTGACEGHVVCTLSGGGETTAIFTTEPSGGEWSAPPAPLRDSPPPPFEVPGYAITEITHSPYGLFLPRALDEDGDVLGGVMNCGTRPARYDAASGSYSILTPLPEDDAEAISAASDGTILVRDLNFWRRSYRWKDGVLESIGSLGGQRTYATAMNAAGWVVGWADLASGNGTPHAFLHDGTTMKDLGEGFANAVSGAGEIVGIKGQEAAVFESPTILLPIPSRAVAYDVSDTGVVVGSAGQGLDQKWPPLAFVYDLRTGSVTEVAPLPGDVTVTLVDVNRSGTLAVGGSGNREQARSVVWADGHLYDFSTYVGVQGAPTTIAVRDVNDRGQFLISSSIRYYVLTPR